MPARSDEHQGHLFDDSPSARALELVQPSPHATPLLELGARLDPHLHMGTSSWSFPGWKGLVYKNDYGESALARHGLTAYAAHPLFRSVGLDRAFYQPLSVEEYTALAAPGARWFSLPDQGPPAHHAPRR